MFVPFISCSEKYLQNLLQIEVMLKIWFPQVTFQPADAPSQTTIPRLRTQWHQNQLHMPVKVSTKQDLLFANVLFIHTATVCFNSELLFLN